MWRYLRKAAVSCLAACRRTQSKGWIFASCWTTSFSKNTHKKMIKKWESDFPPYSNCFSYYYRILKWHPSTNSRKFWRKLFKKRESWAKYAPGSEPKFLEHSTTVLLLALTSPMKISSSMNSSGSISGLTAMNILSAFFFQSQDNPIVHLSIGVI